MIVNMLSLPFFTKHLETEQEDDDPSTRASSSYVFMGGRTFRVPRDSTCMRVDRRVKHLDGRVDYGRLFSMELPQNALRMDVNLTQGTSCLPPSKIAQAVSTMISDSKAGDVFKQGPLRHLRNVAFPARLDEKELPTFENSSDLGRVLPARRNPSLAFSFLCNGYALRDRFDGLPIHYACYYHSHDSAEVALRDLREGLKSNRRGNGRQAQRDCLGFTPLHILACSTKHRLEMYEALIELYPEQIVAEDKWGDVPLLYALWGRAPRDVVDFLASGMKERHPNYRPDWLKMIETFSEASAPPACLEFLFETCRVNFPEQHSRLRSMNLGRAVAILCVEGRASEEDVERFVGAARAALRQEHADLSRGFFELALRKKFGFKPFWLGVPISKRLASLQKREHREKLDAMIRNCPTGGTERNLRKRVELANSVLDQLDRCETIERLWGLELALWKARIEDSSDGGAMKGSLRGDKAGCRSRCRITSGADVIVPNVVPYLRRRSDFFA